MLKFFSFFQRKKKIQPQCQVIGYNKFVIHGLDFDGDVVEINHQKYLYENGVFTRP